MTARPGAPDPAGAARDDAQSPLLTELDLTRLAEGTHYRTYEQLGAHLAALDGVAGVRFAVWAPNAERVSVLGDFNDWDPGRNPMAFRPVAGVWECFVPGVGAGALYTYQVASRFDGYVSDRADPYGFAAEVRPRTASRVADLGGYPWGDREWMESRGARNARDAPISIYEVHLGSWQRVPEEGHRWLTYREVAPKLADHAQAMGFTHVELLPITEHPVDGSWGYQTIAYFAPTSRFGPPRDFMSFVDCLHQRGIGVILDWIPAHFPRDSHALAYFDGTHLYGHADPLRGEHPDWDTLAFDYGRAEVRNFLVSNALFWFDRYHVDGLRVDSVASMLYLDGARRDGEWSPNRDGGKENIEAIEFIRLLNEQVYAEYPAAMMIAEESTAWSMVSRPAHVGGLGFGYKWNMGWMRDVLGYMAKDPIHRSYHHDRITFGMLDAFTENFILPFSHDEVAPGKGSMIGKMPGDDWQQFANLRLLYGYMFTHPGKQLLFMGSEFGQRAEWRHEASLDWHLVQSAAHAGLMRWVRDLNTVYRGQPALFQVDFDPDGFEWVDCHDYQRSVISFLRRGRDPGEVLLVACNFTPVPRANYRVGVPSGGYWKEVLNSDATLYGGSGEGNMGGVEASPLAMHGRPYSLSLLLPPLGIVVLKPASRNT
jgi:1,4-alpha-glucan branching enzyme